MSDTPEWCPDVVDLGHTDCEVCEQARRRAARCERCAELEQAVREYDEAERAWTALYDESVPSVNQLGRRAEEWRERDRLAEERVENAKLALRALRARQGENDAVDS